MARPPGAQRSPLSPGVGGRRGLLATKRRTSTQGVGRALGQCQWRAGAGSRGERWPGGRADRGANSDSRTGKAGASGEMSTGRGGPGWPGGERGLPATAWKLPWSSREQTWRGFHPTPPRRGPQQTDLAQLLPPPSSPYLPGPFLMAHFRRQPQPAPLMEALVCGVSRPSFRRLVRETGAKKNVPSQAGHCLSRHSITSSAGGLQTGARALSPGTGS